MASPPLLPFLKSFLKPTLAGQTDGPPPQTDEMLNRGESACPNDTRQKAEEVEKGSFISRPGALIT